MSLALVNPILVDSIHATEVTKGTVVWSPLMPASRRTGIVVEVGDNPLIASVNKPVGAKAYVGKMTLSQFNPTTIYAPVNDSNEVVNEWFWGFMAERYINKTLSYAMIDSNCHVFTAMCMVIDDSNPYLRDVNRQLKTNPSIDAVEAFNLLMSINRQDRRLSTLVEALSQFNLIHYQLEKHFGKIRWVKVVND